MQDTRRSFYQTDYKASGKPIYIEDMGNLLTISGILLEGMDTHILVLTPGANQPATQPQIIRPTIEEWSELLRMSDDPKIFEMMQPEHSRLFTARQNVQSAARYSNKSGIVMDMSAYTVDAKWAMSSLLSITGILLTWVGLERQKT